VKKLSEEEVEVHAQTLIEVAKELKHYIPEAVAYTTNKT
jgi:hypothetical protein